MQREQAVEQDPHRDRREQRSRGTPVAAENVRHQLRANDTEAEQQWQQHHELEQRALCHRGGYSAICRAELSEHGERHSPSNTLRERERLDDTCGQGEHAHCLSPQERSDQ